MIARMWRRPLIRMLMLSLGLHAAVIMIVQPRPFAPVAEMVVIDARLQDQAVAERPTTPAPLPAPAPERPLPPPEPAPAAEARPVVPPSPSPASIEPAPPAPAPRPPAAAGSELPSIPVMIDTNWYEARQLDSQPRAVARIEPPYPPMAQRRGIEGSVKLKLRIDEFGVVREATVEEAEPPGLFDESALVAFRQGRFVPAVKDGRPVRALIYVRVRYELND